MASISGTLQIRLGESRIDGQLLAVRNGKPNELVAATNEARNAGLKSGDAAKADGSTGTLGNVPVFFMTSIRRLGLRTFATRAAGTRVPESIPSRSKRKASVKQAKKSGTPKPSGTTKPKRRSRKR